MTQLKIKMGKGGNHLQNVKQEIKKLQDSLDDLDKLILNLYKKID